MATITARMTARKGLSTALPKLLPGELGLATDIQKTFIGQEPVVGSTDITNSTDTTAIVEFMSSSGYPVDLDEITTTDLAYGITVTDNEQTPATVTEIPGASITFADQKATFTHPLKESDGVTIRKPNGNETFSLWYNKEVGYVAEVFTNPARTVTFTAAAASTPQTTGIEFLCENKESVTLSYTLKPADGPFRRGTLSILLDNNAGVPTVGTIKDEYDIGVVQSGSFIIGKDYNIATVGTTDFTLIGATINNVGTQFTATGSGTGTGTASLVETPLSFSLTHNSVDKFILNFETPDTVNAQTFTYIQKSFK